MTQKDYKVLITDAAIRREGIDLLEAVAALTILPSYSPTAEVIKAAEGVDAILARTTVISEAVVCASPKLKIVSRHGVGVDNVDVAACTRQGVLVTITGNANAQAVAEYAFGCILAVARKVILANANMDAGMWKREPFVGVELHRKVLGIIGLGRVGSRLAKLSVGFEMTVLAYDPYIEATAVQLENVKLVDLETLLSQADFISLHMPLTPETSHFISTAEFELMKSSVILVNTARGELIDEAALYQALVSRRIAGAALDVFQQEPLPAGHPLTQLDHVLHSPHIAGQTAESLIRMSIDAAEAILQVFRGQTPAFVVNPEVLNRSYE